MARDSLPKKLTVTAFRRRRKLGEIVRSLREKKGLTMMEAAMESGVSLSTWARWESGRTAIPLELVADICRALGDAIPSMKPYLVAA